jgi:hypothetical protein
MDGLGTEWINYIFYGNLMKFSQLYQRSSNISKSEGMLIYSVNLLFLRVFGGLEKILNLVYI